MPYVDLNQTQRLFFLSGYAREIISVKMLVPDDAEFINQPVLPTQFLEAIRKLLG